MPYGPDLIGNGGGQFIAGWDVMEGPIGLKHGGFRLGPGATLGRTVQLTDINTAPRELLIRFRFMVEGVIPLMSSLNGLSIQFIFKYNDGTQDTEVYPLIEDPSEFTLDNITQSNWTQAVRRSFLRQDSILQDFDLIITNQQPGIELIIKDITLQRNITDMELHNNTEHPHNLPLAISVGNYGIKATKGDKVMFWLRDTGDAEFAGELKAASGSFTGELQAATGSFTGELRAATGSFSGELQAATGTFTGTLNAASGTFNGTVKANKIDVTDGKIKTAQIEELVVGGNVIMGPNATISWGNITNQPDIDDLGGVRDSDSRFTHITRDGIYTGNLRADQIAAGSISADNIYGGTLRGVQINVDSDVYVGKRLTLDIRGSYGGGVFFGGGSIEYDPYADSLLLSARNVAINGDNYDRRIERIESKIERLNDRLTVLERKAK